MPSQRHRSFSVKGDWFRWSRYQLVNGVVIPAPEARLSRYDPWASFRANAGKYRTVSQPYLDLLELHRSLQEEDARGVELHESQERRRSGPIVGPPTVADHRTLDWCHQHGHLGILPIRSTLVRLKDVEDRDELAIRRTHYIRDGALWRRETALQFDWVSSREATEERLRDRARKTESTLTWFNFGTRAHDERPLEDVREFFPTLEGTAADFIPPLPLTDEFWQSYGEPVSEITAHCRLFRKAVDYMKQWNPDRSTGHQDPSVRAASMLLRDLAQNVPLDDLDDTRTASGLLASYALMFLWDRAERRRCLQCEKCNRYFVSNDIRARYCSPSCRNRVQSRRHRAKQASGKRSKETR